MILASDILSGAYLLLGRPSQADLHYGDMLDLAEDLLMGRLLDMKLVGRGNFQTIGEWTTPDASEMSALAFTNGETNIIPRKMEWRYIGDNSDYTNPRLAEIISFESLNEFQRKSINETAVAFYNGAQEIAFSELNVELLNREYRLTFTSMSGISFSAVTSQADLPSVLTTMCKYELALLCLDQVINETERWMERRERLRNSLMMEFLRWEARFKKLTETRFGSSKVSKMGGRLMRR